MWKALELSYIQIINPVVMKIVHSSSPLADGESVEYRFL
jgi:hypothetical protein